MNVGHGDRRTYGVKGTNVIASFSVIIAIWEDEVGR